MHAHGSVLGVIRCIAFANFAPADGDDGGDGDGDDDDSPTNMNITERMHLNYGMQ